MTNLLQWINSCSWIFVVILVGSKVVNSADTVSRRSLSQRGLCRYAGSQGNTIGCCYGWQTTRAGRCEPTCQKPCIHGTCTGPNICTCDKGYTGVTCHKDHNECGDNICHHRCMNTVGSYRCYCRYGHVLEQDGRTCRPDNQCRLDRCHYGCMSGPRGYQCICPDGMQLGANRRTCVDIDECTTVRNACPRRRRCQNTFGSYMCVCDAGYSFQYSSGKLRCRDDNECELDTHQCSPNAKCYNNIGSYSCICDDGFVGDGKLCYLIDPLRCEDKPCSPLVTCVNVDFKANSVEAAVDNGMVRLYECGPCPYGYNGDGETCTKTDENVVIVVVDKAEPEVPVEGASIKLLVHNDDGATTYSEGITSFNGFVTLRAPTDHMVIVTSTSDGYMDSSVTYYAITDLKNVVTIYMEPPSRDHTIEFVYDASTPRALEFSYNDGNFYEFILSEGSLNVADGEQVTATFSQVSLSENTMDGSPELVAMTAEISNDAILPGLQRRNLEVFGMVILQFHSTTTQRAITLKTPMAIRIPISDSISVVGGDTIPGWVFNVEEGVWYQDGAGQVNSRGNGLKTWSYQTSRVTWIAAARPWPETHCVEVYVCYDEICDEPVPNAAVWMNGLDFHYATMRRTNTDGKACFNFKKDASVTLQSCFGSDEITVTGAGEPSSCSEGQWHTPLLDSDEPCQVVTIIHTSSGVVDCGHPDALDNGARIGTGSYFGANVTFVCDSGFEILGNSQRLCHDCGEWSGSQPICFPSDSAFEVSSGDYF